MRDNAPAAGQAALRPPRVPATGWLQPLAPAWRFAFYGNAWARSAAQPVWGTAFPEDACRARANAARAALWVGPEEYLLLELAPTQPGAATFEALERALQGVPHALVDVSHRQFAVEVHGPHAATILSGACPLDLELSRFPVGMCTRTVLGKADILLWRTREHVFHVEIWRSFAGYAAGVLAELAAEFYP